MRRKSVSDIYRSAQLDIGKSNDDAAKMADEVPQSLKRADLNLYKTATRGAQLQTVKPIIAYWCKYAQSCLRLDPE